MKSTTINKVNKIVSKNTELKINPNLNNSV